MVTSVSNLSAHSDVDRVRDATDLAALIGEHIALRPKGREHIGLCPFHDDHSPSLTVVTHKGNGFYKCHSCGAAGDAFNFVMDFLRKDFGEALRYLADRAGIRIHNAPGVQLQRQPRCDQRDQRKADHDRGGRYYSGR